MVWLRDWNDTWCGLGTGTIHGVVYELGQYMVWFRDWEDTWCGLGTGKIHGVV